MYNQCANKVLKYFTKSRRGLPVDPLENIGDGKPLPPPPGLGEFDCIIAGFPWFVIPFVKKMGARINWTQ